MDCRPTQSRMVGDHYEVKVDGEWMRVPSDKINNVVAPDGGAHVCAPRQVGPNKGVLFASSSRQRAEIFREVIRADQGDAYETSPPKEFPASGRECCCAATVSRMARVQTYPTRPIRLVIPFPPGGAFDALGRPWAERIKSLLGTVVVENIGGGGASLGAAAVARARPDGYTILLGGTLPHINEALLKSWPLYDPVKDLDPIGSIAANFISIAVHPSVPAHNLKEFIAYAKANSGKLSYGHAGIGSTNHLTGELFMMLAGTSRTHAGTLSGDGTDREKGRGVRLESGCAPSRRRGSTTGGHNGA